MKNDTIDASRRRPLSEQLPPELFEISPASFGWRVVLWLAMLAGGVALAMQDGWLWFVAGGVLLGLGMAHGVELSHQALHNTGFKSPKWNEVFGVAMGLPMLVSFHEYRLSHLRHHAKVGTPEDTEFFNYGEKSTPLRTFAECFLMTQHYQSYGAKLLLAIKGASIKPYRERHQKSIRRFYFLSVAFIAVMAALSLALSSAVPLLLWLFSLIAVATPVHALVELPEHYGCADTPNVLENTRTLGSNWLMRWFTNSNNYHVEHHYYPAMPLQNVQRIHHRFRPNIRFYSKGYRAFYAEVISRNFARKGLTK